MLPAAPASTPQERNGGAESARPTPLESSLVSDPGGHPTQQKAKLVPADSDWCRSPLEKSPACLFLIPVQDEQANAALAKQEKGRKKAEDDRSSQAPPFHPRTCTFREEACSPARRDEMGNGFLFFLASSFVSDHKKTQDG